MEWVETTGRTVDDAKDAALDELGVAEEDAEFEVVEEPRQGLFGRLRNEARVRARVRPTTPRPKEDRRRRGRRRESEPVDRADRGVEKRSTHDDGDRAGPPEPAPVAAARRNPARRTRATTRRRRQRPDVSTPEASTTKEKTVADEVDVQGQAVLAEQFLTGLVEAFELEAQISTHFIDEETFEIRADGDDLGLMIGPKGATLAAIQELTRTAVQRQVTNRTGRILVDVGGYQQRRKEALARFTRQLAEEVVASGTRKILEPMSPADRKVVHDTCNDIDGVRTLSEGEEPRRRVVIEPEG